VTSSTLLAVPNVSEGRDQDVIEEIGRAFDATLLDVHSDPDHHRSVFTLAGGPGQLASAVVAGAQHALELIDLNRHEGAHPRVGAIDVAPIVYVSDGQRGAACAEALVLAARLGDELGLPVFLYGVLAADRTRAELRRGGPAALAQRLTAGELRPDFGPPVMHPTGGAVLVAARPPLVAFNVELAPPASAEGAKAIAARIREGGEDGLQSVRAIGLWLAGKGVAQVSTNVEDPEKTSLADVVDAIRRYAPPTRVELVGLAPQRALEGFPSDLPIREATTIEAALTGATSSTP
jgi:glutamate formiminotransferase